MPEPSETSTPAKSRKQKRTRLYAVVAIGAGTFLMLAALEGILALFLSVPALAPNNMLRGMQAYYLHFDRDLLQFNPALTQHDPDVSYLLRPGQGTFSNREFSVDIVANSVGLRDDEADLTAPEVICLGDSFCQGWGVEAPETYPALLQRADRKVLNAGMSSFGTVRELTLLKRLDRSALKTLIIQYCSNDAIENAEFVKKGTIHIMSPMQYKQLIRSQEEWRNYRMGDYLRRMLPLIARAYNPDDPIIKEAFAEASYEADMGEAELFMQVLQKAPVNLSNIHVIVIDLYSPWHPKTTFIADVNRLAAAQNELNVTAIDLCGKLSDKDYFRLDDHLNAAGHITVATALEEAMK